MYVMYVMQFDAKSQDKYVNDVQLTGALFMNYYFNDLLKVNWENMNDKILSEPAALVSLVNFSSKVSYTDSQKDDGAIR